MALFFQVRLDEIACSTVSKTRIVRKVLIKEIYPGVCTTSCQEGQERVKWCLVLCTIVQQSVIVMVLLCFQEQVIEFAWKDVKSYEVDEEGMSFNFEYNRPGKKPRLVKIFTPYVSIICTTLFV